jgi:hypothetical protein
MQMPGEAWRARVCPLGFVDQFDWIGWVIGVRDGTADGFDAEACGWITGVTVVVAADEEHANALVALAPAPELIDGRAIGANVSMEEVTEDNQPLSGGLIEQPAQTREVVIGDGLGHRRPPGPEMLGFAEVDICDVERAQIRAIDRHVGEQVERYSVPSDTESRWAWVRDGRGGLGHTSA